MLLASLSTLGLVVAGGWATTGFVSADAEARHPPRGRFVELPGGRLHLRDSAMDNALAPGSDTPVFLLVHGASSHHADLWTTLGPPLSRHGRVIAIDRPGHGWSDRLGGREMADPARQASAMIAALERIGVSRVIAIGHSLAGAVSTRMALDRPDLVQGLILLAAVSHPWPGAGITWYYHPTASRMLGEAFTRLVAIPTGSLILEASIAGVFAPQQPPPDYAESAEIRLVLRPGSFVANAQDVAVMHDFVASQHHRYGELAMPVTAIAGAGDEVVWTDIHSRGITRQARRGKLIVLPGVGHMPHHTVPELIVAEAVAIAQGVR